MAEKAFAHSDQNYCWENQVKLLESTLFSWVTPEPRTPPATVPTSWGRWLCEWHFHACCTSLQYRRTVWRSCSTRAFGSRTECGPSGTFLYHSPSERIPLYSDRPLYKQRELFLAARWREAALAAAESRSRSQISRVFPSQANASGLGPFAGPKRCWKDPPVGGVLRDSRYEWSLTCRRVVGVCANKSRISESAPCPERRYWVYSYASVRVFVVLTRSAVSRRAER